MKRLIANIENDPNLVTVVLVGGLHGNEKAGLKAIQSVVGWIFSENIYLNGNLYALAGNIAALSENERFLEQDLNRLWVPDRIGAYLAGGIPDQPFRDDLELQELLKILHPLLSDPLRRVVLLDLHTTSSDSVPFVAIAGNTRSRQFITRSPVPIVINAGEFLRGTLFEYIGSCGHIGMVFEAGQHTAPDALRNQEAAIWVTLLEAGLIKKEQLHIGEQYRLHLKEITRGHPRIHQIEYRHEIKPGNGFVMEQGYDNFTPIYQGSLLAHQNNVPVHSPTDGFLFLPLYQKDGSDGFFITKELDAKQFDGAEI